MRIPILLFIATLFIADAFGQHKIAISTGLSKDFNHKIRSAGAPNQDQPLGFAAGISYLHNSGKRVSFLAKVGFDRKSFQRESWLVSDGGIYTTVRINYLYFAPQATLKLLNTRKSNLFFSIGPYVAIALGGKEKGYMSALIGVVPFEKKIIINDSPNDNTNVAQVKRSDLGVNSSISYQLYNYGIMLTWQQGLKNIVTHLPWSTYEKTYKNSSLELALYYSFNLSRHKK